MKSVSPDEAMAVLAGLSPLDANGKSAPEYLEYLGNWDMLNDMPKKAMLEILRAVSLDAGTTMPAAYEYVKHLITEVVAE